MAGRLGRTPSAAPPTSCRGALKSSGAIVAMNRPAPPLPRCTDVSDRHDAKPAGIIVNTNHTVSTLANIGTGGSTCFQLLVRLDDIQERRQRIVRPVLVPPALVPEVGRVLLQNSKVVRTCSRLIRQGAQQLPQQFGQLHIRMEHPPVLAVLDQFRQTRKVKRTHGDPAPEQVQDFHGQVQPRR